jgi:hypothetical protein
MLGRHKLLLLIPAILLIPILFGMTPLNMSHRLASGGPFTHCKQAQWNNHCPFNSAVSHDDLIKVSLNSAPLSGGLPLLQRSQISLSDSIQSSVTFNSVPLRC